MNGPYFRFLSDKSDGLISEWLCNNASHIRRTSVEFRAGSELFEVIGDCDGSCKRNVREVVDVRKLIDDAFAKIRRGVKLVRSQDSVELNDGAEILYASNASMIGTVFRSWYMKRSESGRVICLGSQHLAVSQRSERRQDSLEVTLRSCDGSCKITHVKLSRRERKRLREVTATA